MPNSRERKLNSTDLIVLGFGNYRLQSKSPVFIGYELFREITYFTPPTEPVLNPSTLYKSIARLARDGYFEKGELPAALEHVPGPKNPYSLTNLGYDKFADELIGRLHNPGQTIGRMLLLPHSIRSVSESAEFSERIMEHLIAGCLQND